MTLPTPGRRGQPLMRLRQLFEDEEDDEEMKINKFSTSAAASTSAGEKQKLSMSFQSSSRVPGGMNGINGANGVAAEESDDDSTSTLEFPTKKTKSDMSFPSREELEEPVTAAGRTGIKRLKLSKPDIFITSLGEWLRNLSTKEKETLTMKILKRRAEHEAYQLKLETKSIPLNWLEILEHDYGLKVYRKVHKSKIIKKTDADSMSSSSSDEEDNNNVKKLGTRTPNGTKKTPSYGSNPNSTEKYTSSGRKIRSPAVLVVGTPKNQIKIKEVTPKTQTQRKPLRKLEDLTDQLPPGWWLKKLSETGIAPPSEIIIVPMQDKDIACWNYDLPEDYYSRFKKVPLHELRQAHSSSVAKRQQKQNDQDRQDEPKPSTSAAALAALTRTTEVRQIRYSHEGNGPEWPPKWTFAPKEEE